ncbi:MAG TPA: flagellum-specific ATP synthase FliI, partial [Methylomirabilota bacterium]|nr:flagellum-specific ATP synthase FliI [Methylomirabilota bacterium]
MSIDGLLVSVAGVPDREIYGRVAAVQGLLVEVAGPVQEMSVGARLVVTGFGGASVGMEVVGFRGERALCLPFGSLEGVRLGAKAALLSASATVRPSSRLLGRVVNAFGAPIDGKGPIAPGPLERPLRAQPPPASERARVGQPVDLG